MSARAEIAKLNREIRAISQTPCSGCGHSYSLHLTKLRCYGLRCKCRAFVDHEASAS